MIDISKVKDTAEKDVKKAKEKIRNSSEEVKDRVMVDLTGTCKYCKQVRMVKAFPDEDPNEIATDECDCDDAKRQHNIKVSVEATKVAITKKFKELIGTGTLTAIETCLDPVVRGELDSATFKIDGYTFTVAMKDSKLACVKKFTEVDIADENGVPE